MVHERKHKGINKYANQICNTYKNLDSSVLREVTCDRIARLNVEEPISFASGAGLYGVTIPRKKLHDSLTAIMEIFPERVSLSHRKHESTNTKLSVCVMLFKSAL